MGESMEHSDYITLIEQQKENWRTLALTGANEINKMRQQLTIKENDVNSLKGAIQACDHIISIINENIEIVEMEEGTEPESETDEDDILITLGDIRVYVDPHSAGILEKTVIDYIKTLQKEGFVFNNPKANTTCGCGSSFS